MSTSHRSPTGIASDRAGPPGQMPVVLLHAGVADRRMWDPQWSALTAERDAVRLDLRGFGDSSEQPSSAWSPSTDVIDTLSSLGIDRCHLVGASFGAGVAVEVTLTKPDLVESLLLSGPGGSLIAEKTPDLAAFVAAEESALDAGNLDTAVEANLSWWVDGPHREAVQSDPAVRGDVGRMQRRAFELVGDWEELEVELDPPALDRLPEVNAPTLVLVGGLDLDAILDAARRVGEGISGARRVDWPDTAHLPSLERPGDFMTLLREWLGSVEGHDPGT